MTRREEHSTQWGRATFIALLACVCLGSSLPAAAQSIRLAWDPAGGTIAGYRVYIGTATGVYSQSADVPSADTTYEFVNPQPNTRYYFVVTSFDNAGAESPRSNEVNAIAGAADAIAPTVTITSPASGITVTTSPLIISGTAGDNVTVASVRWSNSQGGSGTASGTTAWTASVPLQSGSNVITMTASDGLNTKTASVTVTYAPPDTTAPNVAITSPAGTVTVASAAITVSGTASDNVGVAQVTWTNNRGGSGTASGTTTWTAANVPLQTGTNVLTVTARDAAYNIRQVSVTVTYNAADTTAPALTINAPSNGLTVFTNSIGVAGSASDNIGVTQVTWSNSGGGSGTASGTTSWSVANVTLQPGTNTITVTARDAAGNRVQRQVGVTYTAPVTVIEGVRDTFTQGDGIPLSQHPADVRPLGSAWRQLEGSTAYLRSGRVRIGATANFVVVGHQSGLSNASVAADFTSSSAGAYGGIVFRVVDVNRLLLLRYSAVGNQGNLGLFRRVNGEFQWLAEGTVPAVVSGSNHRIEARLNGTQVQAVWDGVVVFTRSVSDYQGATEHGLLWNGPTDPAAQFDNFQVQPLQTQTTSGAPVLQTPSNQSGFEGDTVSLRVVASDPQGQPLSYTATGLPNGLAINLATGVIGGTIPMGTRGSFNVAVAVSDGMYTTTGNFTWTVSARITSSSGVVDSFTGTDGTPVTHHPADVRPLGTAWAQLEGSAPYLRTGRIRIGATANYAIVVHQSGLADASVSADITSSSAAPYGGIVFRAVDTYRMLLLRYTTVGGQGNVGLFRRVNGEFQWLAEATVPAVTPGSVHRLEARLEGSSVQAVWDGAVVFTRVVADYATASRHGLLWNGPTDPNAQFDNFRAQPLDQTQAQLPAPDSTTAPAPAPQPGDSIVADSFTATDGTQLTTHDADQRAAGTSWSVLEGRAPYLQGGEVRAGLTANYAIAAHESNQSDGSVSADFTSTGAVAYGGVVFRAVDAGRMLILRYITLGGVGNIALFRRVNGEFYWLAEATVPAAARGAVNRLEARFVGSQVQAVWNDVVLFTHTVSDYQSATRHGVLWNGPTDPTAAFDNFRIGSSGGQAAASLTNY